MCVVDGKFIEDFIIDDILYVFVVVGEVIECFT